jgi:urease alpha subunit
MADQVGSVGLGKLGNLVMWDTPIWGITYKVSMNEKIIHADFFVVC